MKKLGSVNWLIVLGALIPTFFVGAAAQRPSSPSPIENRGTINNETYRELMKAGREGINTSVPNSDPARANLIKQLRLDFKGIQDVNNKMMSEAWARQTLDYGRISDMISDINAKANRLKTNLLLPEVEKKKKKEALVISDPKEFRSALLRMDHSIMSFVTNPIFRSASVIEVHMATQASQDLENVIGLSENLKKIAAALKNSTISNR